jgi:hypothetical protein
MSREVDPNKPQSNDDLLYLAQRNQLPAVWVEKLGGDEGVSALLNGEKVVRFKKKAEDSDEAEEADDDSDDDADVPDPAAKAPTKK